MDPYIIMVPYLMPKKVVVCLLFYILPSLQIGSKKIHPEDELLREDAGLAAVPQAARFNLKFL